MPSSVQQQLVELDGFLAGLLICPEVIPPCEWFPMVRITGQCRPDRDTIGGSSAERDYRMSRHVNARVTHLPMSPIFKAAIPYNI